MSEKIAVIGLGYVGLPVAVALASKFEGVVGFDISQRRVESLLTGRDSTGEISSEDLKNSALSITDDPDQLCNCNFFIVTVPTPIDRDNRPDLKPVEESCKLLGSYLKKGSIVVFESTVYPGVTEDFCGPLLEQISGLKCGKDFFLGYSPERINPGDKIHKLETIIKVVSAQDENSLERVVAVYGKIIAAGLHVAPTIKVAEAAKVIENTQRDLNIALMNELSLIFDRMNINTSDVLAASSTKWNFLPFSPGLVGGHCIGVDPYYLTSAAERVGYRPEVILAGRRINDSMGSYVAQKLVKLLANKGARICEANIAILGLTFKENVPDLRNSKVPDIVGELTNYSANVKISDAMADSEEAKQIYGLSLIDLSELSELDALIIAVPHNYYLDNVGEVTSLLKPEAVVMDLKSAFTPKDFPAGTSYWSL